jgi:hypothetical protein
VLVATAVCTPFVFLIPHVLRVLLSPLIGSC